MSDTVADAGTTGRQSGRDATLAWARWLSRVRPVELAELLKRLSGVTYGEFVVDGRTWYLDPTSNFGLRLLSEGCYEPGVTEVLLARLAPGDVFLDVGANEGWFAVRAAERVGEGRVVAVEPQERLWPVLVRNFLLNGLHNYVLVPQAAGAAEGVADLTLYPSLNTGASSLVPTVRTRARQRQRVDVLPLERMCQIHGIRRIRLAKIDVEGYELEVLKGAGPLLGRDIEHIILELHPRHLRALGQSPDEVEHLLASRGYQRRPIAGVNLWSLPSPGR
jgi:FkbM family methyltransferase